MSQGYLGPITNESFSCANCNTAKYLALSFNNITSISVVPFDLVYYDIWGRPSTPTTGGSRYYVLFIDDYYQFIWIHMMKNWHEIP